MRFFLARYFSLIPPWGDYYVYAYSDPRTNTVFYVGKGKGDRIRHHLKERRSTTKNHTKLNIIESIRRDGLQPTIYKLVPAASESFAYQIEQTLISAHGTLHKSTGSLANLVTSGWQRKRSPNDAQSFAMISKGVRAAWKNPESKLNSPEYREALRVQTSGENNPRFGDHRSWDELHGTKQADDLRRATSQRYSGAGNPRAKTWRVVSPAGDEYTVRGTLREFCRSHNLYMPMLKRTLGHPAGLPKLLRASHCRGSTMADIHNTVGWSLYEID